MDWFVICVGVDDFIGIAVPAVPGAFFPQQGAVEVWLGDAEEGEGGDFDEELDDEEVDDCSGELPSPWDSYDEIYDTHGRIYLLKLVALKLRIRC